MYILFSTFLVNTTVNIRDAIDKCETTILLFPVTVNFNDDSLRISLTNGKIV